MYQILNINVNARVQNSDPYTSSVYADNMRSFHWPSMDLDPLTKAKLWIQGLFSCVQAVFQMLYCAIKANAPDLDFKNVPWHIEDYICYAERVNGRVAMIVLSSLLLIEYCSGQSIWRLIHVL